MRGLFYRQRLRTGGSWACQLAASFTSSQVRDVAYWPKAGRAVVVSLRCIKRLDAYSITSSAWGAMIAAVATVLPKVTSSPIGFVPMNVLHIGERNIRILFTRILEVEGAACQEDGIAIEILGDS
jgi:hypothetical protein